jgi:hypothetical protein
VIETGRVKAPGGIAIADPAKVPVLNFKTWVVLELGSKAAEMLPASSTVAERAARAEVLLLGLAFINESLQAVSVLPTSDIIAMYFRWFAVLSIVETPLLFLRSCSTETPKIFRILWQLAFINLGISGISWGYLTFPRGLNDC